LRFVQFCLFDISRVTADFHEYTKVYVAFSKMSEDPKLGNMLSLKFPSLATHIVGGDGDGWRHGLLKGYNRVGMGRSRFELGVTGVAVDDAGIRDVLGNIHVRDEAPGNEIV
jgi:hypothetical protein